MSPGARTGAHGIRQTLGEALRRDPRLMVVGEMVDGLSGSLQGLAKEHPDQVLQVPIAERGALGLALGLALGGRPVVVEVASTSRLRAAIEVLAEAGAVAAAGEFPVPLCVRVPHGTEWDGTHAPGHDVSIGSWLLDLPGVSVVCPSTPGQLEAWLGQGLQGRAPLVVLEPVGLYTQVVQEQRAEAELARPSHLWKPGRHVTLAAVGHTVEGAMHAAGELLQEGLEAEVLELARLSPLEVDVLGASVRRTGRLVVVHPGDPALARHISHTALEQAFWWLEAPLASAPLRLAQSSGGARAVVDAARTALIA